MSDEVSRPEEEVEAHNGWTVEEAVEEAVEAHDDEDVEAHSNTVVETVVEEAVE